MSHHPEVTAADGGVVLAVHVQPGAGRTEVVGRHGDALKLRVAAPPTGNRANDAVVELVAKPMEMMTLSSMPTNLATSFSAWAWRSRDPAPNREPKDETLYRFRHSSTASAHPP